MKRDRIALYDFVPYGAPELLEAGPPHLVRALTTASTGLVALFAIAALLSAWLVKHPGLAAPPPDIAIVLQPPPSIDGAQANRPFTPPVVSHLKFGVPLPVRDDQAQPDDVIPTQSQLQAIAPGDATANPGAAIVAPPETDEVRPSLDKWTYYDEEPVAITRVVPVYPDLAREAGVDGTVLLRVLVGKDGTVKDVHVDRSVPLLDEAAIAAARQWVFTPALSNGKPVMVWVAIPIKFSLH